MIVSGVLTKMKSEIVGDKVKYYLNLDNHFLAMNDLIGRKIKIDFLKQICLNCKEEKEIFRMGNCKNCFFTSPKVSPSIINPEKSKAHLGIEVRDLEWEKAFELQSHIVYISNTGGVKVGVTRDTQIPTRWIDQGASQAIVLAKTPNRYLAGMIEVELKNHISDKTNYRKMLTTKSPNKDIVQMKNELVEFVSNDYKQYICDDDLVTKLEYPVEKYPQKIEKNLKINTEKSFTKTISGIKGQYMIFDDNTVFNVRSNEGNFVEISV